MTIAVIEDDIAIGDVLEILLSRAGYRVIRAYSGTEALLLLKHEKPSLILLDLLLPGISGEEVLTHIPVDDIPVMVLSAKAETHDKVELLRGGACDYVTKPFDSEELLARIAAHLRRRTDAGSAAAELASAQPDRLQLVEEEHSAVYHQTHIHLTRTEYAILKLLSQNPGRAIAKSSILDRIALETPDCTDSSLKQHVSNLRRKLKEVLDRDCIEAVWGIGFRYLQ